MLGVIILGKNKFGNYKSPHFANVMGDYYAAVDNDSLKIHKSAVPVNYCSRNIPLVKCKSNESIFIS